MHKHSFTSLAILISSVFVTTPAISAVIPTGTVLAENQEVTRHLKTNPHLWIQ